MRTKTVNQGDGWRKIRPSIRFYCYRAAELLAEGRELAEVRPRPWTPDLAPDRPHLIRALSDLEWSDEKSSDKTSFYFDIRLYDLVLGVCQRGARLPISWGLVLELLDATGGKASVKPLASHPVACPDKDDSVVVLSIAPGSVNQYAAGIFQGEKPKWNPKLHTLSHNGLPLRVYPGSGAGPRILVGTGVHTFAYPLIPQCVSPIGRTSPTPSGRS